MNAHSCGSIMTQQELKNIASVPTQIISPSKCKPIITLVQDTLVSSYLMTQNNIRVYRKQLYNLMMNIRTFDGIIPEPDGVDENGVEYWSGKTAFSLILPDISLRLKNNSDETVMIKNGKYLEGSLDSSIIGSRGLIQDILKMYGTKRCHEFLDETQNIFTRWLETYGFSVGIGDAVPVNAEIRETIDNMINDKVLESKEQITLAYQGLFEPNLDDKLRLESMDLIMKKIANDCAEDVVKYIKKTLPKTNRFKVMATSGAKGKDLNIRQIMGLVGQQDIWGHRIHNGFTDRTLPHFHKYDFGLAAKGFVRNSFVKGVGPAEFFFAMMGGRVGMIDTAVKSVTGDTPILITENGKSKRVLIGEWIDEYLDNNTEKIEHYDEKNLELFRTDDKEFYIPTCDEKGNTSWGRITALTRHDLGNHLFKITTLGGREVIVPESKSLLIWNEDKQEFIEKLTPEVRIGDSVPTTQYLPKFEKECEYINVYYYLPKNEYIYGTDFYKAYDLVFNKYNGKVPTGWWKENNGTTFTLPYKYAHRMYRVAKRSNLDYIKEGYVYPYRGQRIETFIPDKFELNRENGVFIGLYLAEGCSDFNSGYVSITNNAPEIQNFVSNWFDKHSIKWEIKSKINNYGGTSTTIRGNSRVLVKLIDSLCNKGARNKHIPNEAYIAPEDFVIGLLDGYFSGDGTVGKNSIEASSASKSLIEGISSLCSRLGLFCKRSVCKLEKNNFGTENIADINRLSIRAQWATKFSKIISLTHIEKNRKLSLLRCCNSHRNFDTQNDVVLDKIVSIELINDDKYSKLYDLTVPSTTNFALANGMNVYDTADTGYISRRLMKAEEDVKVEYDGTVRNASGNVVELMYGDDNYDPVKLEKVSIELIKYNNLEMNSKYKFEIENEKDWENYILKTAMKDLLLTKEYKQILDDEFNLLMKFREDLRYNYFKNRDVIDIDTYMPFNLFKYIPAIKFKFNIDDKNVSDLNPVYIVNRVQELCNFVSKYTKDKNSNTLTKIFIKSHLASKMVIHHYKLNQLAFDFIIRDLENKIISSFVQAGEMVGPVSAQSLGEANTQLTLNTFHSAGAAAGSIAVTAGVPRMKEIINLSSNMKTPSMNVYLKEEYSSDRSKAEMLKRQLEYTQLKNIISKTSILYEDIEEFGLDVNDDEDSEFMKLYYEFNDIVCVDEHSDLSKWVLRMEFDREEMMSKNILMSDVQDAILQHSQREEDIQCLISDDNSANLVMRIKIRNETDDDNLLSYFQDLEKYILDMTLRGVKGIIQANLVEGNIVKYDADGSYKIIKEWYVRTNGSNLADVMLLDYVDTSRTMTNNIIETYEVFGIEGVRARIISELEKLFSGEGVNRRHVSLLTDVMTHRGTIMQIDRHGINRSPENSVLTKASFEEVTDIFIKASTFGEFDKMNGVSGNIMFGQVTRVGTNMFDLMLDQEKIMQYAGDEEEIEFEQDELDEDVVQDDINEMYEDMNEELEIDDDDFEFGYGLEHVQEYNIGTFKKDLEEMGVKVVNTDSKKKKIKIVKKK